MITSQLSLACLDSPRTIQKSRGGTIVEHATSIEISGAAKTTSYLREAEEQVYLREAEEQLRKTRKSSPRIGYQRSDKPLHQSWWVIRT